MSFTRTLMYLFMFFSLSWQMATATEVIQLGEEVRFKSGDDPNFSNPDWDDRDWEVLGWRTVPPEDFVGVCWLRATFTTSPDRKGKPIAFHRWRVIGAATFYLNGEPAFSIGQPGGSAAEEVPELAKHPKLAVLGEPWRVEANGDFTYVLAIRHSNFVLERDPFKNHIRPGVRFTIDDYDTTITHYREDTTSRYMNQWVLFGICISFSLLHFLLFVFYPKEKSNLFFAMVTLSWTALTYSGFTQPATFEHYLLINIVTNIAMASLIFFTVAMGHALMFVERSPILIGFLAFCLLYAIYGVLNPLKDGPDLWLLVLMIAEMVRVMSRNGRSDAMKEGWIIGLGSIPISCLTLYNFGVSTFGLSWSIIDSIYYHYGMIFLLFSMSVFLAYRMSNFRKSLEQQIIAVRQLSEENLNQELERVKLQTENDRKTAELEAAREFQLSMLPKTMPDHPELELAATMSTATEVGGDYYDVFVSRDQTLTCVVGDATGHGIQAGTFVAGTKTLFNALAEEQEPPVFLQKTSRALKMMGLRKMFMALTFARYRDQKLTLAAAGMPLALHYKHATKEVQEILLKAPPLASLPTFPYQTLQVELTPGDVVLIFSDGLPERFNPQDEMFGEARMKAILAEKGHLAPIQLLEIMVNAGAQWGEGRVQDDDITLLVIKRKA